MTSFAEYESFDGLGLANLIKTQVISPTELLEAAIERIELSNQKINAVIYKMYDEAQAHIKKGLPSGLFEGVPFLLKDLLADYANVPMQCGSRLAQHYIPLADNEIVKRFKQAGLVILGKTNTPEFGLSPTTEPVAFGPTHNPWDLTKTVGGSSGGSAAAVAARMVPIAHGNDGGGSIRIPAAYCGIFGLKPSRGRTPVGPNVMRSWQGMCVNHVLTRSVRDSAAMLDVISGPELGSPFGLPKPRESFMSALTKPLMPLKIAVAENAFFPAQVSPEYASALSKAGNICHDLGHQVNSVSLSIESEDVSMAYLIVIAAETAETIKNLKNGLSGKVSYNELELTTDIVREVGKHFSAEDYAWSLNILDKTERKLAEFFQQYDVLISPTMAGPPPSLGSFKLDGLEKNILQVLRRVPYGPLLRKLTRHISKNYLSFTPFTPLFNITGQPAMSVPLFWDKQGLPIGIQFVSKFGQEKILLGLAQQLEKQCPWGDRLPS